MAAHDFSRRNFAQYWAAAGSGLALAWTALRRRAKAAPQNTPPPGLKRLNAKGEPADGPISSAVVFNGMIYATCGANDVEKTDSLDIADHVTRTMNTLKRIVEAGGGDMGAIKILTVHLASLEYYGAMNRVYQPFFQGLPEGGRAPARCTMAFGQLANGNLFQITCIAAVKGA